MAVYEIRVKGHLDGRWSEWFDGLAKNLSELDVAYRSGWSVGGSKTVERWAPKGQGGLPDLDSALRLVVPRTTWDTLRSCARTATWRAVPRRTSTLGCSSSSLGV